jgi:NADH dehydrogenase (ubiquinone) 1 alpha subcomplex subunit 5
MRRFITVKYEHNTNWYSISDLESRLGAGLIEEVIQVAEGEHKLVDTMIKSKV